MIVILQNTLLDYRRGFFNELALHGPVTVVHSGGSNCRASDRYREVLIDAQRVGPFWVQAGLDRAIEKLKPTAIIAMFDLRWISIVRAMFRWDHRVCWVWWGLDAGGSKLALKAKLFLARRPNPIVFYSTRALNVFRDYNLPEGRLFLGNNTFHVPDRVEAYKGGKKTAFINVGSLLKRKQNDVLIRAFANILEFRKLEVKLIFVGSGPEQGNLMSLASSFGISDSVFFLGQMSDPGELAAVYYEAIASISFGQAGLAVLQSMAFGVPFVTKRGAISGGEIANIVDGENGLLIEDSQEALEEAMRRLVFEDNFARMLGHNAYSYYSNHCSIDYMVAGFISALKSCRNYGLNIY